VYELVWCETRRRPGAAGPSYFFIPLVLGPLNSLLWYVKVYGARLHFFCFCKNN
jgi:hypothetical protein